MPNITGTSKCLGTSDFLVWMSDVIYILFGVSWLVPGSMSWLVPFFFCVCVLSFFVSTKCVVFWSILCVGILLVSCIRYFLSCSIVFGCYLDIDISLVNLGGGFKHFLCSPLPGEMIIFWRAYFSIGLVQPPTRKTFLELPWNTTPTQPVTSVTLLQDNLFVQSWHFIAIGI